MKNIQLLLYVFIIPIVFLFQLNGCVTENKSINHISLSFENSKLYEEIPGTEDYEFIRNLGKGFFTITEDSIFIIIPENRLIFKYLKTYVESNKNGDYKISVFNGKEFSEIYISQQSETTFVAELYVHELMIKFVPNLQIKSVE